MLISNIQFPFENNVTGIRNLYEAAGPVYLADFQPEKRLSRIGFRFEAQVGDTAVPDV